MLNPILYKENDYHNPTELLVEVYKDIESLTIKDMFNKYKDILTPYEISGLLNQEITSTCSREIFKSRIKSNGHTKTN